MKTEPLPVVRTRIVLLVALCLLLLTSASTRPAGAQEACTPPPDVPAEDPACASPSPMSPVSTWKQNAAVHVVINADQFSPDEFNCLKAVFESYNAVAGADGNSSGVRFNATYSSTPAATLTSPYTPGGANLAVNAPGITNGLQVNKPQDMGSVILGSESIGTDGTRRNSAVLNLNPNITDCKSMAQILAHEIGHTLGLKDCCHCPRASTVMNCGACAEAGTDANGNRVCVRADYNNSSNGRSSPTTCDSTSIKQAGQYDPSTVNQPPASPTQPLCGSCPTVPQNEGHTSIAWCDIDAANCFDCIDNDCDGAVDYDDPNCTCMSPIIVDTLGNGFEFTDGTSGVEFEIDGDGIKNRLSWTSGGSDDAWLALDRNANGTIDDGSELFGNFTAQPDPQPSTLKNGFLALAEFDKAGRGGNADGVIDGQDAVFASLRLWRDTNHDGISQAGELYTLPALHVESLSLSYREVRRRDRYGNGFRYQATVTGTQNRVRRRLAFDVFLVPGQ